MKPDEGFRDKGVWRYDEGKERYIFIMDSDGHTCITKIHLSKENESVGGVEIGDFGEKLIDDSLKLNTIEARRRTIKFIQM